MAVYVDNARHTFYIFNGTHKQKCFMSHMYADFENELHEMAEKIGVKHKHYQNRRMPHYDITVGKRQMALSFGAKKATKEIFKRLYDEWKLINYSKLK